MTLGLHCTIYVYATVSLDALLNMVAGIIHGEVDNWIARAAGFEIAGVPNDEYNEERAAAGRGDFLFFPYLLEVEEVEPTGDRPLARQFISDLLDGLRASGLEFVTAADFENELPDHGRSRR